MAVDGAGREGGFWARGRLAGGWDAGGFVLSDLGKSAGRAEFLRRFRSVFRQRRRVFCRARSGGRKNQRKILAMNTHFIPLNEVTPQCVVALTWTLKDSLGEVLDELQSPVEFLVGGDDLLPRIDEALQGYGKGARLNLNLEPADAFGDFDEQLIFLQPRHLLPADLQEGMLNYQDRKSVV